MADFLPLYVLYVWRTNTANRKDVAPTNPRGIPYAPFVDRVEDYVSSRVDVEPTLKNFQEMISYVEKTVPRNVG